MVLGKNLYRMAEANISLLQVFEIASLSHSTIRRYDAAREREYDISYDDFQLMVDIIGPARALASVSEGAFDFIVVDHHPPASLVCERRGRARVHLLYGGLRYSPCNFWATTYNAFKIAEDQARYKILCPDCWPR